ncbi:hypothetical protein [Flavobacterium sp.]|uniref:hypothetical protein n=1 Tax=Flavobacterium sp. TaxID=239 RepID=UPI0026193A13|nr:hypothetical protein [Flavobacterium sp.]
MHTTTQFDIRFLLSLGLGVLLLLAVLARVMTQHVLYAYHRYLSTPFMMYGLTAVLWASAVGAEFWETAPLIRVL